MSNANRDLFTLKAMINKEKNTLLFVEADCHFADVLLSFLTLPLGRIIKILEKYYGDDAPTIGSLTTLRRSLSNLDIAHFWTPAAKQALLDSWSCFDDEYAALKLNTADPWLLRRSMHVQYFSCRKSECSNHDGFRSVSLYYDELSTTFCKFCTNYSMIKSWGRSAASSDGLFLSVHNSSFTISDDLQIFPNEMGLLRIIEILGITDAHKAEQIQVNFGLSEIMNLLKLSLTSPTPLSDVILGRKTQMNYSAMVEYSQPKIVKEEIPNPRNLSLKVMIQKSTGKFLYAQAQDDFIEFLFSFFHIPLGRVEHLLAGKTNFYKAVNNLNRSASDLIDVKYFKYAEMKSRVMKLNLVHGSISEDHIFPLVEEPLPDHYDDYVFSPKAFDKGSYVKLPRTFQLTDDLIVTPFCNVAILSYLNDMNIPISDVKEVELQIGVKEGLSILKAALSSTSAITDALLKQISIKQVKREF